MTADLDRARELAAEVHARGEEMLREPLHRDEVAGVFISIGQAMDIIIDAVRAAAEFERTHEAVRKLVDS
jgi:hypothetical protein